MKNIACLLVLAGSALQANSITILSGASSGCTLSNYGTFVGQCNNQTYNDVAITYPWGAGIWGTDPGGAQWVSFEQTGVPGMGSDIDLPNATPGSPNAEFYLSFDAAAGDPVSITVWVGTHSAGLYFNGSLASAPC